MAEPVRAATGKYTYADILTWPEDERWELIDGVAYDMTPAPRYVTRISSENYICNSAIFLNRPPAVFFSHRSMYVCRNRRKMR